MKEMKFLSVSGKTNTSNKILTQKALPHIVVDPCRVL